MSLLRFSCPVLCALLWLSGQASAAAGWAAQATGLFPQPSPRSSALRVVAANERLDLKRCAPQWCLVRAGAQEGWVLRAAVNMNGTCAVLVPLGLKDLRRNEAAYSPERDPDGNGRACDQRDFLQMVSR